MYKGGAGGFKTNPNQPSAGMLLGFVSFRDVSIYADEIFLLLGKKKRQKMSNTTSGVWVCDDAYCNCELKVRKDVAGCWTVVHYLGAEHYNCSGVAAPPTRLLCKILGEKAPLQGLTKTVLLGMCQASKIAPASVVHKLWA